MKTKSIKSIAALLGAAVALNLNVLAGPGPQLPLPERAKTSEQKTVRVSSRQAKVPTIALAGTKTGPSLTEVSGPHGTYYGYRR